MRGQSKIKWAVVGFLVHCKILFTTFNYWVWNQLFPIPQPKPTHCASFEWTPTCSLTNCYELINPPVFMSHESPCSSLCYPHGVLLTAVLGPRDSSGEDWGMLRCQLPPLHPLSTWGRTSRGHIDPLMGRTKSHPNRKCAWVGRGTRQGCPLSLMNWPLVWFSIFLRRVY